MTTRKRADRRTGGLLPELERPETQRYKCRPVLRKWAQSEDLLLVAAVANCRGENAYAQCCVDVLELLGRKPTYPPGVRVPKRQYVDTCIRYCEVRLITKMIAGYGNWKMPAGFGQFRAALPELTWGERVKVVKPFWKKAFVEDKLSAEAGTCSVLRMLHRDGPRSHLLAMCYMRELDHHLDVHRNDDVDGRGDLHARSPLAGARQIPVQKAFHRLAVHMSGSIDPTGRVRQDALEDLYQVLSGGDPR